MCKSSKAIATKDSSGQRIPPNQKIFPHMFQNQQQMWLKWYEWWPRTVAAKDIKGVLFLISGLGEHGARYEGFAEEVAEELHFAVFTLDHQGQGLSEGERKYVERFEHYVADYLQFIMTVFGRYGDSNTKPNGINIAKLPRFLLGHSMGGLIALHTARACANGNISEQLRSLLSGPKVQSVADAPTIPQSTLLTSEHKLLFNSLILSGPAIKPDPNVATPTKKALAKMLSNVSPKMAVGHLDIETICGNPQVVEYAKNDVLFAKEPLRARWGHEMLLAMGEVQENPKSFVNFPLLLVHGEKDAIVLPAGSAEFYKHAEELQDKKMVMFIGKQHEILNEIGCEEVREEVKVFIKAHMHNPDDTKVFGGVQKEVKTEN